ncbi:retrovirus-related pol polyprotein from transposon TNT 1-94 [Tanacetum coccineum]
MSSGGGPPNFLGSSHKVQMAPKAIKEPLVCSPDSEKSVSFQKSILCPRPKHMMVNNVKIPVASDNEVSLKSKSYIILNKQTIKIKELLNVTFDETPPPSKTSPLVDDDLDEIETNKVTEKKNLENNIEDETLEINEIVNIKESRNHPLENVIGNLNQRTLSHRKLSGCVSKLDKNGIVSQNKARLVAQGYNQQEGIGYNENYALVARLESIIILLAYACTLDFKLFQMDVKSAFMNGFINEEVYVAQPPGFIDFEKPDHVYKLKKALYGLKQEPKAWYDRLKVFLIKNGYKMRMVDNTLFT